MRRADRQITQTPRIKQILSQARICRLGFNTGEAPYLVALNFGWDWPGEDPADLKLYFHCAKAGRKLDLLKLDPRVGILIDIPASLQTAGQACDWGQDYQSICGQGILTPVEDDQERRHGLDRIMAAHGFPGMPEYHPAILRATTVLKLTVDQLSAKARIS